MEYGLKITPKNGNPYIFNAETCFLSVGLAGITPDYPTKIYDTGYSVPSGYEYYVIFNYGFPSSINPKAEMRWKLSGSNTVEIYINDDGRNVWFLGLRFWIILKPLLLLNSYGMMFSDGDRYSGLADGDCIYTETESITTYIGTGWKAKDVFPSYNESSSLLFFYTEESGYAFVILNSLDYELRVLKDNTFDYTHGHKVKTKVVLFDRKALSDSDNYGLSIYAKNGDLVFNSSSKQVVNFKAMTISTLDSFHVPSISRPMFIPSSVAVAGSKICYLTSDGNMIKIVRVNFYETGGVYFISQPSVFIDATAYFDF